MAQPPPDFVSEDGRLLLRLDPAGKAPAAWLRQGPNWVATHAWPGVGQKPVELQPGPAAGDARPRLSDGVPREPDFVRDEPRLQAWLEAGPGGWSAWLEGGPWKGVTFVPQSPERMALLDLQRRASAASAELREAEEAVALVTGRLDELRASLERLRPVEDRVESLQREVALLAKGFQPLREEEARLERLARSANKVGASLEELPGRVSQAGTSVTTRLAALERETRESAQKMARHAADALQARFAQLQEEAAAAQRILVESTQRSLDGAASRRSGEARDGVLALATLLSLSLACAVLLALLLEGRLGPAWTLPRLLLACGAAASAALGLALLRSGGWRRLRGQAGRGRRPGGR